MMNAEAVWHLRSTVPDGEFEFFLEPGEHILGSSSDAELQVNDHTVSRRHARVVCTPESVTVEDLGSTNGTVVDGTKLEDAAEIRGRTSMRCGRVSFVFEPMVERTVIEQKLLSSSSGGSVLLGPATVGFLLRDAGGEVAYESGEVVIRRGDHQDFFYVVIDGEVELVLQERDSRGRPMARLGSGAIFGAESVLAKEGAAVDAVAVGDVRLLRYPAKALPRALQESSSLRRKMLGGIARSLHDA